MATALDNAPPVGLVIVTHGGSGECLLAAAEGLVGPLAASAAVSVSLTDPFDEIVRRVGQACDWSTRAPGSSSWRTCTARRRFGLACPCSTARRPVEIVCGINLPMLIKLATVDRRGQRPVEVAEIIKEVGKRSIRLGSELTGKLGMPREERH